MNKKVKSEAIKLLYELIRSEPERSVFNSDQILKYINKGIEKKFNKHYRLVNMQVQSIHVAQLKYHIYKRQVTHQGTYYVCIKRSNKDVAQQIKNMYLSGR